MSKTLTLHPQGVGRDCKDAKALKDSDPLRAETRAESYASTLTLLTRNGCPLCEDMADEIHAQIAGSGHRLVLVDVDTDPALKARYGWDVPLLFDGATEICRHELNLLVFREWLRLRA